ncbi:MAG: hypothetical protein AAGD96_14445 [Chloroflexota bacterium]
MAHPNGHKPDEERKQRIKRIITVPAILMSLAVAAMIVGAIVVMTR